MATKKQIDHKDRLNCYKETQKDDKDKLEEKPHPEHTLRDTK